MSATKTRLSIRWSGAIGGGGFAQRTFPNRVRLLISPTASMRCLVLLFVNTVTYYWGRIGDVI
jgi:hypothetical protein